MAMTIEEFEKRFPDRPKPIPAKYAGQWIAWDLDCNTIIAHGEHMATVQGDAEAAGCSAPILQKVPRGPFVGRI